MAVPRIGVNWQLTPDFLLKMFAGSAFKAPTIAELYSQNNPVGIGNADLTAASIDTIETGLNAEYFIIKTWWFR